MNYLKLVALITVACAIIETAHAAKTETAIFAGGCFWSMQHDFDKMDGIVKTTVGYTGGTIPNPTYEQVSTGTTGHYESIKIEYNPAKISYAKLVDLYLHDTDPSNGSGQFCDTGNEYRPAIFTLNPDQEIIAAKAKDKLIESNRFPTVATAIMPAQSFYPAEVYHQKYSEKNPVAYSAYRFGCGRDKRVQEIWGK